MTHFLLRMYIIIALASTCAAHTLHTVGGRDLPRVSQNDRHSTNRHSIPNTLFGRLIVMQPCTQLHPQPPADVLVGTSATAEVHRQCLVE